MGYTATGLKCDHGWAVREQRGEGTINISEKRNGLGRGTKVGLCLVCAEIASP